MADRWKTYGEKDLRGAVAPTYSWASPGILSGVQQGTYNSKNMPLMSASQPVYGIGIANYNWRPNNVHKKIDFIRQNKEEKSGGTKQIWEQLNKWADSRSKSQQGRWLKSYSQTGKVPKGLTMDTILNASDHALRDTARGQQHKGGGFFSTVGNIFKSVAPAVAGSLILPGVGTALGTTISGATGGALAGALAGGIQGGWKGAALGGASGYGIGYGVDWARGLTPAQLAQQSAANAVPGMSTGVTTPVGGGGLTTAQAAGRATVGPLSRTGLSGAVLNSAAQRAALAGSGLAGAAKTWLPRVADVTSALLATEALQPRQMAAVSPGMQGFGFSPPPTSQTRSVSPIPGGIPSTGIRERLSQNLAQRLGNTSLNNQNLIALSPLRGGLLS